jgi:hypothetical protein
MLFQNVGERLSSCTALIPRGGTLRGHRYKYVKSNVDLNYSSIYLLRWILSVGSETLQMSSVHAYAN